MPTHLHDNKCVVNYLYPRLYFNQKKNNWPEGILRTPFFEKNSKFIKPTIIFCVHTIPMSISITTGFFILDAVFGSLSIWGFRPPKWALNEMEISLVFLRKLIGFNNKIVCKFIVQSYGKNWLGGRVSLLDSLFRNVF